MALIERPETDWGYGGAARSRGIPADAADAMAEKGYLKSHELWDWPRPYTAVLDDGIEERHPKIKFSDGSRFYLDGRVKYHGRWVGRWWVGVDPRARFMGNRFGEERFWRVRPSKVHDPVYLAGLLDRMVSFASEVLQPRYEGAATALYEALPEGGDVYCDGRESEKGVTYYATVHVPSHERREEDGDGLSFGSGRLEEPSAEGDPLVVLSRQEKYMRLLEVRDKAGHLASAVNHHFSRKSNFWRHIGVVKEMLFLSLTRHLPDPYHLERFARHIPAVEMRVGSTRYFFRLQREGRNGIGWSNVLTLRDGDENSLIQFNFQPKGD